MEYRDLSIFLDKSDPGKHSFLPKVLIKDYAILHDRPFL